jgi:hypothetical protein
VGILALDRRIDAEVLDARGALSVVTGGQHLRGTLRDVPQLFVAGAQLSIALQVGGDRFDAVCRVLDEAVVVTPGSKMQLEVLKASPADVSGIEPFDLVPRTPPQGVPPPVGPATLEDMAPEDDEPTGVVGTLREMPVSEIVQTLNQGARDALVEVRPKGAPQGQLYIERGRVIHASTADLTGDAAFFALFQANRGAFRIRYGRHTRDKNITRDTVFLLLEGARLLDELNSGKQFPPAPTPAPIVMEAEPPVLEPFEAGVTLVDQVAPPGSSSGPFMRFFDEAGVQSPLSEGPPPLPRDTMRFQSLKLPDVMDDDDDLDRVDTDRTLPARKRNSLISEPPREP